MRCTRCGAMIPDGQVICPECGAEVQIVPDYNPLDDVLAQEVRGSVEGATRQIMTGDVRRYRRDDRTKNVNSTRVMSQNEMNQIREQRRRAGVRGKTDNVRRNKAEDAARNKQKTGEIRRKTQDTAELRRERQQKRMEAARRRRRNLLITLFLIAAFIGAGIYIAYQNSYTGMLNKGYKALQRRDYASAEEYFKRAIVKDKSRAEAYTGYAEVFSDQEDTDGAEQVFLNAIETQPTNAGLYQAAIEFYMNTEQQGKISMLLKNCEDTNVLDAVSEYISSAPEFKPDEGTYSEVQEITLVSSTGGDIYYTTDGSDPTAENGKKYEEPVLLQNEGTFEIKAISINANGIPSVVSSGRYVIEFPIADPPAVTPSTGQYTEAQQITITVPEGYTAYYTTDGTEPTVSSAKYTGPVDMPQDTQTIFKAVLVNDKNGKMTGVTTRNYISISG